MNNKFINFYNKNGYFVVKVFNKNEINSLKYLIKQKIGQQLKNKKWDFFIKTMGPVKRIFEKKII